MLNTLRKSSCLLLAMGMISVSAVQGIALAESSPEQSAETEFDATDFEFESYETNILNQVEEKIKEKSEMHSTEQAFLNGLIRKYKPKKILELGVSAGGSSVIMLNASKDIEGSKVYSIDKLNYYYKNPRKNVGYLVKEKFPKLTKNWNLYTGDIPCSFMDKIGDGIDFVLIDTIHVRPGEINDFLSVLPYLKENAIVCFHDIGASFNWGLNFKPAYYCNDILFSCIKGEKILPRKNYTEFFPNIGAIKLDDNQKKNFIDYFFLLSLPWEYIPEKCDSQKLISHFQKHYGSKLTEYYKKSLTANINYRNRVRIKS